MESSTLNTIICPQCHAELPATADICARCGAVTKSLPGAHSSGGGSPAGPDRLRDRPWLMTILLLHLGVFGIPLYWRSRYSRNVRIGIVVVSILYTLLVAVAIVWGVYQVGRAIQAIYG